MGNGMAAACKDKEIPCPLFHLGGRGIQGRDEVVRGGNNDAQINLKG